MSSNLHFLPSGQVIDIGKIAHAHLTWHQGDELIPWAVLDVHFTGTASLRLLNEDAEALNRLLQNTAMAITHVRPEHSGRLPATSPLPYVPTTTPAAPSGMDVRILPVANPITLKSLDHAIDSIRTPAAATSRLCFILSPHAMSELLNPAIGGKEISKCWITPIYDSNGLRVPRIVDKPRTPPDPFKTVGPRKPAPATEVYAYRGLPCVETSFLLDPYPGQAQYGPTWAALLAFSETA